MCISFLCVLGYFKLHDKRVRTESGKQDRPRTTGVRLPLLFFFCTSRVMFCRVYSLMVSKACDQKSCTYVFHIWKQILGTLSLIQFVVVSVSRNTGLHVFICIIAMTFLFSHVTFFLIFCPFKAVVEFPFWIWESRECLAWVLRATHVAHTLQCSFIGWPAGWRNCSGPGNDLVQAALFACMWLVHTRAVSPVYKLTYLCDHAV